MDHHLLNDVLVLLAFSVLGVALLRSIGLPPILGYLLVGMVAGPHALGWLPDDASIRLVAEVGLVFLLFTIGLEFSLAQVVAMRGVVFGVGGAQVVITVVVVATLAWLLGMAWPAALVVGGAMAMSSTALVTKQLHDQLELRSRHGRLAIGVLLFQDLAVVPFLAAIPILATGGGDLSLPLLEALGKAMLALIAVILVGRWALRPLFHAVARTRSGELFTLTALLVALAAAALTNALGLSLALGAFLAGMVLGETEFRHQIESAIGPFRDVLMGLFFIGIGSQLVPAALPSSLHWVVLALLLLVPGKALLMFLLGRLARQGPGVSLRAALVLAQGGEFGFALIALGVFHGLVSLQESQPLLAALVISMALSPLIIRHNGELAKRYFGDSYLQDRFEQVVRLGAVTRQLHDHVLICGYGRIGQNLASFLRDAGYDYVALDLDPALVREARDAGEPVFYGDATHVELLIAAGLHRARALVVTVENPAADERIVRVAHAEREDLPVLVRILDEDRYELLERAGASDVIPGSVEASLSLATYLLQRLQVPTDQLLELVEGAREDHFRQLRGVFQGESPALTEGFEGYGLRTVVLDAQAWAVGRSLAELGLEAEGIVAKAVRRAGIRGNTPDPSTVLRDGDALIIEGLPERLSQAEHRLRHG